MIRRAGPADRDAVVAIESEALGPDAWSRTLLADGLAGGLPTMHYLVVEADGAVCGYAAASIVADIVDLQRIAVSPTQRREGHATALLAAVASTGRGAGADRLLLEVRADNADALGFYAAAGLVEIDRRKRYYRDGATAVVMRLALGSGCG